MDAKAEEAMLTEHIGVHGRSDAMGRSRIAFEFRIRYLHKVALPAKLDSKQLGASMAV